MRDEELDSLPLVLSESSSSRQGCWLLLLSLTASFTWLVPSISLLYLLIDHNSWQVLVSYCHHWLEHNHWDLMVTSFPLLLFCLFVVKIFRPTFNFIIPIIFFPNTKNSAWSLLDCKACGRSVWAAVNWVDNNHSVILIILSALCLINIALSVTLTISTITNRRGLAVPWLVFNALIIFIMLLIFTCWTFISFFISILLAIIFPVLAGVVLGVWILMWKKVYIFHHDLSEKNQNCDKIVVTQPRKGYTSVPALHNSYNHRTQHLMTIPET